MLAAKPRGYQFARNNVANKWFLNSSNPSSVENLGYTSFFFLLVVVIFKTELITQTAITTSIVDLESLKYVANNNSARIEPIIAVRGVVSFV